MVYQLVIGEDVNNPGVHTVLYFEATDESGTWFWGIETLDGVFEMVNVDGAS